MLRNRKPIVLLWLLAVLAVCGCGARQPAEPEPERTAAFFAMDTYMTFRIYGGDDALPGQAQKLVQALEAELSVVREDSAVYTLNHTGRAELSAQGTDLLRRALALCAETDGALDLSIYPVVRAWGFTAADGELEAADRVPSRETIDALLEKVDYRLVALDGNAVSVPEGMEIDLGAVAKGYAGDLLADLLQGAGVKSAILALGGNIQAVGSKPDGSDWIVGVQDPSGDGLVGTLPVSDKAVVTSGGYERFFTDADGNIWWHIMDPKTGYPARSGLISVTVVGDSGLVCDALSTALFIMGPDEAVRYWDAHRDFDMVLVTEDDRLLLTGELARTFVPEQGISYSLEVIGDD